jgi:ribonuclease HII
VRDHAPVKRARVKRTFGVDEAGRGPILGPMAIAVVVVDSKRAARLTRLGVMDSKRFGADDRGRRARAELANAVREHAIAWALELVDVTTIDRYVFGGRLNELEREVVTRLLDDLGAARTTDAGDRIVCDGKNMFAPLRGRYPTLEAVNKGESVHVSVAAASIVAKDARDRAFAEIAERYADDFGPLRGGGYLNARTRAFLDAYHRVHGQLPPEARKSWGAPKREERA